MYVCMYAGMYVCHTPVNFEFGAQGHKTPQAGFILAKTRPEELIWKLEQLPIPFLRVPGTDDDYTSNNTPKSYSHCSGPYVTACFRN